MESTEQKLIAPIATLLVAARSRFGVLISGQGFREYQTVDAPFRQVLKWLKVRAAYAGRTGIRLLLNELGRNIFMLRSPC